MRSILFTLLAVTVAIPVAAQPRDRTAPEVIAFDGCYYLPAGAPRRVDSGDVRTVGSFRGWPLALSADPALRDRLLVTVAPGVAQPYVAAPAADLPPQLRNVPQLGAAPLPPIARNIPQVAEQCAPVQPLRRDFPQLHAWPAQLEDEVRTAPEAPVTIVGEVDSLRAPPRGGALDGGASADESPDGIWIRYAGATWRPAGPAVPFEPDEFVLVGEYETFPVYRAATADGLVYLPTAAGMVAPFSRTPP